MVRKDKIKIDFRIWFFINNDKLLGKGRIELLERIQETGSIAQAARAMKMSYRQAWQMVKEMNERAGSLLVEKQLGGKSGGGSLVTVKGVELIVAFHSMVQRVEEFLEKEAEKLPI